MTYIDDLDMYALMSCMTRERVAADICAGHIPVRFDELGYPSVMPQRAAYFPNEAFDGGHNVT